MIITRRKQNRTNPYYDAILGIVLLVAVCAGLRPDTMVENGATWVLYVLAVFVLIGIRDGHQSGMDLSQHGLHIAHVVALAIGVDLLSLIVDYAQSETAGLSVFMEYAVAHLGRVYTSRRILLIAVIAYVAGAVIGVVWQRLRRVQRNAAATEQGRLRYLVEMLAILGRHPLLTLALYRYHTYYAFLWSETNEVIGCILQCLWIIILLCAALQVIRSLGGTLWEDDGRVIRAIGDGYRRYARAVNVVFYIAAGVTFTMVIVNDTYLINLLHRGRYDQRIMILESILFLVALLRCWNDKSLRRMAAQCCMLFVGIMMWYLFDRSQFLLLMLLVVAAEGISARRILQIYVTISVVVLTAAAWASVNGFIRYYSWNGLHAMGTGYRTDYADHWFYVLVAYRMMRGKRMRLMEYIGAALMMLYVFHLSEGKTGFMCAVIFLCASYLVDYWPQSWRSTYFARLLHLIGCIFYPLCAAGSYLIVAIKGPQLSSVALSDSSFLFTVRTRIKLSYQGFVSYPIRLFGQRIYERGTNSTISDLSDSYYFYLDNAYVRCLLLNGLAFLAVILGVNVYLMMRCGRERNMILMCGLATIAIHAIVEPQMPYIYYNVLTMLAYAVWDWERTRRGEGASNAAMEITQ